MANSVFLFPGDWNLKGNLNVGGNLITVGSITGASFRFPLGTILAEDAANILALKNGTNAQILRVYQNVTGSKYITIDGATGIHFTNMDNTIDIGANGVGRPRNMFLGGNLDADGAITGNSHIRAGSASLIYWNTRSKIISPSDGTIRFLNNLEANPVDIVSLDWGGLLSGQSITLIADATISLGLIRGFVFIESIEGDNGAIYRLNGDANTVSEVSDPANLFTVTKDNAGTINVYFDTSAYFIQNKNVGTVHVRVIAFGATS